MTQPWMPLYVADYLADTRRLTTLEHGAYLLLIMEYWRNGGLPAEDSKLARIAGVSVDEWSAMRETVSEFFSDGWRHKRIDDELAIADARSARARDKARLRHNRSDATAQPQQSHSPARARPSQPQPQPQDSSLRSLSDARGARRSDDPKEILETVLSAEVAAGVVEHRRKLRKPITALAARGLAGAFAETGRPDDAARMMVERGWQGFKPDWFKRDNADQAPPARAGPSIAPKTNLYMEAILESQRDAEAGITTIIPGI